GQQPPSDWARAASPGPPRSSRDEGPVAVEGGQHDRSNCPDGDEQHVTPSRVTGIENRERGWGIHQCDLKFSRKISPWTMRKMTTARITKKTTVPTRSRTKVRRLISMHSWQRRVILP